MLLVRRTRRVVRDSSRPPQLNAERLRWITVAAWVVIARAAGLPGVRRDVEAPSRPRRAMRSGTGRPTHPPPVPSPGLQTPAPRTGRSGEAAASGRRESRGRDVAVGPPEPHHRSIVFGCARGSERPRVASRSISHSSSQCWPSPLRRPSARPGHSTVAVRPVDCVANHRWTCRVRGRAGSAERTRDTSASGRRTRRKPWRRDHPGPGVAGRPKRTTISRRWSGARREQSRENTRCGGWPSVVRLPSSSSFRVVQQGLPSRSARAVGKVNADSAYVLITACLPNGLSHVSFGACRQGTSTGPLRFTQTVASRARRSRCFGSPAFFGPIMRQWARLSSKGSCSTDCSGTSLTLPTFNETTPYASGGCRGESARVMCGLRYRSQSVDVLSFRPCWGSRKHPASICPPFHCTRGTRR